MLGGMCLHNYVHVTCVRRIVRNPPAFKPNLLGGIGEHLIGGLSEGITCALSMHTIRVPWHSMYSACKLLPIGCTMAWK